MLVESASLLTDVGTGVVAHAVHYALVGAGLVGVALLLVPALAEHSRRGIGRPRAEHERRLRRIRAELGLPEPRPGHARTRVPGSVSRGPALLLPLAVVSSAAAAGVHAAVCPAHVGEGVGFALFFAVAALAQLVWAGLALRRSSEPLLVVGAVGNAVVLGLWALTRLWGLPFGLLPDPEAVGPWDLAAGLWELLVVLSCLALVREGRARTRVAAWSGWHPVARSWFVGSVVLFGVLSLSGAGA